VSKFDWRRAIPVEGATVGLSGVAPRPGVAGARRRMRELERRG